MRTLHRTRECARCAPPHRDAGDGGNAIGGTAGRMTLRCTESAIRCPVPGTGRRRIWPVTSSKRSNSCNTKGEIRWPSKDFRRFVQFLW